MFAKLSNCRFWVIRFLLLGYCNLLFPLHVCSYQYVNSTVKSPQFFFLHQFWFLCTELQSITFCRHTNYSISASTLCSGVVFMCCGLYLRPSSVLAKLRVYTWTLLASMIMLKKRTFLPKNLQSFWAQSTRSSSTLTSCCMRVRVPIFFKGRDSHVCYVWLCCVAAWSCWLDNTSYYCTDVRLKQLHTFNIALNSW